MLKLSVAGNVVVRPLRGGLSPILRVTTKSDYPFPLRKQSALLLDDLTDSVADGFGAVLARGGSEQGAEPEANVLILAPDLHYLADGDVIKISPDGRIRTIYRQAGRGVSLLVTERCNSFCLMCSQPPRDVDDDYLIDDYLRAIPLFDRSTREIGITGGEPTLLGDRLFALLRTLKSYLPETAVHVLTNGRTSSDPTIAEQFARLKHPDLMLGIPLYSDISSIHDFVVQADGAYDETLRGIINLKRYGVQVELRVVIHQQTYARLANLAAFITRNLQFVDHVALMGLELMGFARSNIDALWVDPLEYQQELVEATLTLARAGIKTSIYNHQLCLLNPSIRSFSVKSISDWKNEYMPECSGCSLKPECGGFFSSASLRRSPNIRAKLVA